MLIAKFSKVKKIWCLGLKFQSFFIKKKRKFYSNFLSKTIKNDNETLEFVKKITSSKRINFKPFFSLTYNLRNTIGILIAALGNEKRWSIKNFVEVINFLKKKNYKKFLIISGMDQLKDEKFIKKNFKNDLEFIFTADKKIKDVIPFLKKCKFCIGNDTGFAHLSVNLDIETLIIQGDCPPQSYSGLLHHIDIEKNIKRSSTSIHTITIDKVLQKISEFLKRRDGRAV